MTSVVYELARKPTINLVKLIIGRYMVKYGRGISAKALTELLFLTLYTDNERLLNTPRIRIPEGFRIRSKGLYLPINKLLRRLGAYDEGAVIRVGDKYYVKNPEGAFKEAYDELTKNGLRELAEYATRVIDVYGGYGEEELTRLGEDILKLTPMIKTVSFNMDLDVFIEAKKTLRRVLESGEYVDEVELYPDLFKEREGD
jgi:hypothetical protein